MINNSTEKTSSSPSLNNHFPDDEHFDKLGVDKTEGSDSSGTPSPKPKTPSTNSRLIFHIPNIKYVLAFMLGAGALFLVQVIVAFIIAADQFINPPVIIDTTSFPNSTISPQLSPTPTPITQVDTNKISIYSSPKESTLGINFIPLPKTYLIEQTYSDDITGLVLWNGTIEDFESVLHPDIYPLRIIKFSSPNENLLSAWTHQLRDQESKPHTINNISGLHTSGFIEDGVYKDNYYEYYSINTDGITFLFLPGVDAFDTQTKEFNNLALLDQILSTFELVNPKPSPINILSNTPRCGGVENTQCPSGLSCKLDSNQPDAAGVCVIY